MADLASETPSRSVLERIFSVFTEVRASEGTTALLLTLNIFLLLSAYYLIKPVREGLILAMGDSGPEYKSFMGGGIAIALLFAVPAYAKAARRWPRNRLVVGVTLFFASHLLIFYVASTIDALRSYLGLVFYLWVGIFNMMVVAQFWAFCNDLYSEEQGKRLFVLFGLGASLGAICGSLTTASLVQRVGVYNMLLIAAVILSFCAFFFHRVHLAEEKSSPPPAPPQNKNAPKPKNGAFQMVFQHRYLRLLAVFSLVFTFANTNGEYLLGRLIKAEALTQSPGQEGEFITQAFGEFFFYVNLIGLFLQAFVVSRLVKYGGLKIAFLILPLVALFDATAVAIFPMLAVLRIGKIAENATDYSINNTVRNMLWLPTTREMKYQAKQAVDTFFVRMGDVCSALLVGLGAGVLGWGVRSFALCNVILVGLWIWVALAIIRENKKLSRTPVAINP